MLSLRAMAVIAKSDISSNVLFAKCQDKSMCSRTRCPSSLHRLRAECGVLFTVACGRTFSGLRTPEISGRAIRRWQPRPPPWWPIFRIM